MGGADGARWSQQNQNAKPLTCSRQAEESIEEQLAAAGFADKTPFPDNKRHSGNLFVNSVCHAGRTSAGPLK